MSLQPDGVVFVSSCPPVSLFLEMCAEFLCLTFHFLPPLKGELVFTQKQGGGVGCST